MNNYENPNNGEQPVNQQPQQPENGEQPVNQQPQQPENGEQPVNQQPQNSQQENGGNSSPENNGFNRQAEYGQAENGGEYRYVRPESAQAGYAQTEPERPADPQPQQAEYGGNPQPQQPNQPENNSYYYQQQPQQPTGRPPKNGLSTGVKIFIGALIALCCVTLVISISLVITSLNGGSAGGQSGLASSGITSQGTTVSSPDISLDDLVMLEDGENLSPTAAYNKVLPAAVSIKTYVLGSLEVYAEGSGMFFEQLDDGALVLTCAHVVSDSNTVTVTDSSGKVYDAQIVALDSSTDIAVLKVAAKNVALVEFANGNEAQIGQFVMAVGNPSGEQLASSLTFGVLSGKQRSYSSDSYNTLLQFDAAVNPGNSGGMLINMKGQVIGIVSSKIASVEFEGIGFAIPSDEVLPVVKDLCEYGYVTGRVRLGLTIKQYYDYVVESQNLPGNVAVDSVVEGTDAAAKGIKSGDIIVSIDGEKVTSSDQIISIVRSHVPGDTVTLVLYRVSGGRSETVTVTVKLYESKGE